MSIPALEAEWLQAIDRVAARTLGTWNASGDALATEVRALSDTYTDARSELRRQEALRAARLKFFLPRDLPKVEKALVEVAEKIGLPTPSPAPALPEYLTHPSPEPRYHVLDLGAGYGTTSLGLARFLARTSTDALAPSLVIDAIDQDEAALRSFRALALDWNENHPSKPKIDIQTRVSDFTLWRPATRKYQFILLGLSLNEVAVDEELRHAFLLRVSEALTEDGVVVIIEPALKETARALQSLGNRFRDAGSSLHIVGPCTGLGACPLLQRPRDWCHEDLDVDLPDSLQPIARKAGLRYQGLSFSYLTLTRKTVATEPFSRVVGGPIESKGQTEWHLCHPNADTRTLSLVTLRLNRREREDHPLAHDLRRGGEVTFQANDASLAAQRLGRDATLERVRAL